MRKRNVMAGSGVSEEALALNLQQRERVDPQTGCTVVVPALHPSWCKDVNFLCYVPPQENDDSALWLEALELMDSDLHWLLCQPHQRFWCQVMYDTSLHKMLDSYLHYGPRPNETTPPVSQRGREVLTSFHRRVFMTFLRMSTHKESSEHFLLEKTFGDIIYNHFLFDITRLMDLCALYHTCNQPLLAKMIDNVFKRQPRYHDDLKSALNSVLKLLEDVTVECVGEGREGGKVGRVVRLEEKQSLPPTPVPAMVLYVADIAYSLRSFMETYPPSVSLAVECGLLERSVTTSSTLHDKSHLEATRERYQSYQFEIPSDQEEEEGEYEFDQYQDEYDDTYDSHNVGATDSETAEDLFTVKRLNVKGLFKKQFDTLAEEEDEDEGEGEEETESKATPLQPGHVTIMRPERRDGRDVAPTQPERGRGGGGWRGEGGRGGGRGAGRGGREARDRQIKEKHKSRIANHSRKFLADRKRGRGGLGGMPRF